MNGSFYLIELELLRNRHTELLKEAEMRRLVAPYLLKRPPFYYNFLSWLGSQMVAWGERLRQQYDPNACCPPA